MDTKKVEVIKDIHEENRKLAHKINDNLVKQGIFVVNVLGSPGAGKTSTIIELAKHLAGETKVYVIEGDIESDIDTKKLLELGIETVQINTKGACHLDAPMIASVLDSLQFQEKGILFIENIGNLVCPAEFEIGEHIKMLICSAAEGSDKPYKYPVVFEKANVILLNKSDLKKYVDFEDAFFTNGVKALNKEAPLFEVSCKTGEGFANAALWLKQVVQNANC
ncbi:hydrogenase nickel incorporation protein HypB [Bacillota bacterium LX-D]|nr:hydrogenase nickel incorporation protein HypB [Bacillota bacterium LX-D]